MEELLGTTQIQIPLRKEVKQRIIVLELVTEADKVWGAGLSWIDDQQILQVITGLLVTATGEALTLRWVENSVGEVDLPVVSFSNWGKIRQESRDSWRRLHLNKYFFRCNQWIELPSWRPQIVTPRQLSKRRRGDTTTAIDLTRFILALTFSLGHFQNFQVGDYQDVREAFNNLTQMSTGSASWNIG